MNRENLKLIRIKPKLLGFFLILMEEKHTEIHSNKNFVIETITRYNYFRIVMDFNGNFYLAINAPIDKTRTVFFKIKRTIGMNSPSRKII